jgi:hypothetical protein
MDDGICDVCAGVGDNPNCMCGGTGRASDAVIHLRQRVYDLTAALAAEYRRGVDDCIERAAEWNGAVADRLRALLPSPPDDGDEPYCRHRWEGRRPCPFCAEDRASQVVVPSPPAAPEGEK